MPRESKRAAMPTWQRVPEELVRRFEEAVGGLPGIQQRKVFGYPAAFTNGQMFTGVFQDRMFLRLAPADLEKFLALDGAAPFEPVRGRAMRGYALVPRDIRSSPRALRPWLKKAIVYAGSLPLKASKARKR